MKFNNKYDKRIPEELFDEDGHYLGRSADFNDKIVRRRLRLVESIPNFTGKDYSLFRHRLWKWCIHVFIVKPDEKLCWNRNYERVRQ